MFCKIHEHLCEKKYLRKLKKKQAVDNFTKYLVNKQSQSPKTTARTQPTAETMTLIFKVKH